MNRRHSDRHEIYIGPHKINLLRKPTCLCNCGPPSPVPEHTSYMNTAGGFGERRPETPQAPREKEKFSEQTCNSVNKSWVLRDGTWLDPVSRTTPVERTAVPKSSGRFITARHKLVFANV